MKVALKVLKPENDRARTPRGERLFTFGLLSC